MEPKKRRFTLKDVSGEKKEPVEVIVRGDSRAITLTPKGFGDYCSADGHGAPVLLEVRHGVPFLVVWADINQEDPTHIISLETASEKTRKGD